MATTSQTFGGERRVYSQAASGIAARVVSEKRGSLRSRLLDDSSQSQDSNIEGLQNDAPEPAVSVSKLSMQRASTAFSLGAKTAKQRFLDEASDSDGDSVGASLAIVPTLRGAASDDTLMAALSNDQGLGWAPALPSSPSTTVRSQKAALVTDNILFDEDIRPRPAAPGSGPLVLNTEHSVNRHIAALLLDHQVEGVRWMFSKYAQSSCGVLADDMGMGKTIQVAAFLSAILLKSGEPADCELCRIKKRGILAPVALTRDAQRYLDTPPALVFMPRTLVENWRKEIVAWGHFVVDVLQHDSRAPELEEDVLRRCQGRRSDIVLISYSQIVHFHEALREIEWSTIILDEGHVLKSAKQHKYAQVASVAKARCSLMLTGTPIQNDLQELWSLLNLVHRGRFMDKASFVRDVERPIRFGISSSASSQDCKAAREAKCLLDGIVAENLLRRTKETLKGLVGGRGLNWPGASDAPDDEAELLPLLPGKEEIIIMCDLSPLQAQLYAHCLSLPDFDNLRNYRQPCPCASGKTRAQCCLHHRLPLRRCPMHHSTSPSGKCSCDSVELDPRAAIWLEHHSECHPCANVSDEERAQLRWPPATSSRRGGGTDDAQSSRRVATASAGGKRAGTGCPLCVLLPCLDKLVKIANHPATLQVSADAASRSLSDRRSADFIVRALSPSLAVELGGTQLRCSAREAPRLLTQSGKMTTLFQMLDVFVRDGHKTLVFSTSVEVLVIMQTICVYKGISALRMDGGTPAKQRHALVDQFNTSRACSVFLLSSKSGGLGVNLTSATKVVLYDLHWNPCVDAQAQDRAYRIGQSQRVSVFRLLSKNTVEEVVYTRQRFKQQYSQVVQGRAFRKGKFEGVEGHLHGELFGVQNLFQHRGGAEASFLQTLRDKYAKKGRGSAPMGGQARTEQEPRSVSSSLSEEVKVAVDCMDAQRLHTEALLEKMEVVTSQELFDTLAQLIDEGGEQNARKAATREVELVSDEKGPHGDGEDAAARAVLEQLGIDLQDVWKPIADLDDGPSLRLSSQEPSQEMPAVPLEPKAVGAPVRSIKRPGPPFAPAALPVSEPVGVAASVRGKRPLVAAQSTLTKRARDPLPRTVQLYKPNY